MNDIEIYRERYRSHLANGDDEMNARLRIIEEGASVDEADAIETMEGDDDDPHS